MSALAGYEHAAADVVPCDVVGHVTSQKTGASALGLQHVLWPDSYETAWTWLRKLYRAMVRRPGRDWLTGTVEVDGTLLGGVEEWARGRQTEKEAMLGVAAGERGPGMAATGCGGSGHIGSAVGP
jgi:hypothetical protein